MTSAAGPKTALITGGSRGIGFAIARALVREGVRVALVARGAEELATRAKELGNATIVAAADVSDASQVERAVGVVRDAFGDVPDLLVNNAGIFDPKPLHALTGEEFEHTIQINLIAPFYVLRAVLPAWREQKRGHVITLGSIADRTIFPGNGAYSASKFGGRAMHEVLRAETRGTGVRTTLVSPSAVDTPIWDGVTFPLDGRVPPRDKMLTADAVADAVVWAAMRPANVNVDELRLSAS
ncbi:MAG TPA: SDR family oxidoreductase [Gemmatimonadaceae bacterium]|nr:SDR family oxidoreductase [Gemmatimonadaceae bacterium]